MKKKNNMQEKKRFFCGILCVRSKLRGGAFAFGATSRQMLRPDGDNSGIVYSYASEFVAEKNGNYYKKYENNCAIKIGYIFLPRIIETLDQ